MERLDRQWIGPNEWAERGRLGTLEHVATATKAERVVGFPLIHPKVGVRGEKLRPAYDDVKTECTTATQRIPAPSRMRTPSRKETPPKRGESSSQTIVFLTLLSPSCVVANRGLQRLRATSRSFRVQDLR